jgi:hypothetical protein
MPSELAKQHLILFSRPHSNMIYSLGLTIYSHLNLETFMVDTDQRVLAEGQKADEQKSSSQPWLNPPNTILKVAVTCLENQSAKSWQSPKEPSIKSQTSVWLTYLLYVLKNLLSVSAFFSTLQHQTWYPSALTFIGFTLVSHPNTFHLILIITFHFHWDVTQKLPCNEMEDHLFMWAELRCQLLWKHLTSKHCEMTKWYREERFKISY